MVHHIGQQSSILGQYMAEIRAVGVQDDRLRFRHNLARIAEILAYEVSKKLPVSAREVQTPLGTAMVSQLIDQPVLLTFVHRETCAQNGEQNGLIYKLGNHFARRSRDARRFVAYLRSCR